MKLLYFKYCRLEHPVKIHILGINKEILHPLRHLPWQKIARITQKTDTDYVLHT